SLSAREEVYRNFSATLSPTVAGGLWVNPRLKLRASASRSFRVPTYTDLYYHDPANLGSPNLRPERGWTFEGGADWIPTQQVRAELTVFQRRERNGIDFYRTSPTDIWRAFNIQNLNFTGVEASLRLTPVKAQTIDFRYTGLRGVQDTLAAGFTKYTFNYPAHSGVIGWQATLPAGVMLRSRIGVLDRRSRDTYTVWDLYTASSRGRVHPFIQFSNLTSTRYQEILGVWMPGRAVLAGIEVVVRGR